jgi:hypothetical protein
MVERTTTAIFFQLLLFSQLNVIFGSSGRFVAIGVKVTSVGSSADLQSLEWGDLSAGPTRTRQICVDQQRNYSNNILNSASDWVPLIAQQYLTVIWNYASGTVLQPWRIIF